MWHIMGKSPAQRYMLLVILPDQGPSCQLEVPGTYIQCGRMYQGQACLIQLSWDCEDLWRGLFSLKDWYWWPWTEAWQRLLQSEVSLPGSLAKPLVPTPSPSWALRVVFWWPLISLAQSLSISRAWYAFELHMHGAWAHSFHGMQGEDKHLRVTPNVVGLWPLELWVALVTVGSANYVCGLCELYVHMVSMHIL
jgi:hypothetical protein